MNVTLTSLEALILKATHESLSFPDDTAVAAFCTVMKNSPEGAQLAVQALAARLNSPNPKEALLALIMVDCCMRRYDRNFQIEVGKFRFLNELIKLVSPKYYGNRTSAELQNLVLQLLHAWSIEFSKETKFKVALEMITNHGLVMGTQMLLSAKYIVPRGKAKTFMIGDEEKAKLLRKLLQSKKTEDLDHANLIIKRMFEEEERRNDENQRRESIIGPALESANLLTQMLEQSEDASCEDKDIIEQLCSSCKQLQFELSHFAKSYTQIEYWRELLQTNHIIEEVLKKYNEFMTKENRKSSGTKPEVAGTSSEEVPKKESTVTVKTLDDLIKLCDEAHDMALKGEDANEEPTRPVSLTNTDDYGTPLLGESDETEHWDELNSLGEQLMKQSLPEDAKRMERFNSNLSKKIPMNSLTSPKHETASTSRDHFFDLDYFTMKPKVETKSTTKITPNPVILNDDLILDINDGETASGICKTSDTKAKGRSLRELLYIPPDFCKRGEDVDSEESPICDIRHDLKHAKPSEMSPLTDIDATLESVQPSNIPPIKAFHEYDGLSVVLHFCKDKPRADVNVVVMSTTSQKRSLVTDYKLQCFVPKGCKVHLLAPSGTELPVCKPFLPPPALTQIMLIARPASVTQIDLKLMITYICDDEMCAEMDEIEDIPLYDI